MGILQTDTELYQAFDGINQQLQNGKQQIVLESSTIDSALSMMFNHGYLDQCNYTSAWGIAEPDHSLMEKMRWVQMVQLPVQLEKDKYGLMGRWKSVLSAAHLEGEQIAIALVRQHGETKIYIGAYRNQSSLRNGRPNLPILQIAGNISEFMECPQPIELTSEKGFSYPVEIEGFNFAGIVTGMPSLNGEDSSIYAQTMDRLASGIRVNGISKNYAIIIRADSVTQADIEELKKKLLDLKQELNPLASWDESTTDGTKSETTPNEGICQKIVKGAAIGSMLLNVATILIPQLEAVNFLGMALGKAAAASKAVAPLAYIMRGSGGSETISHSSHSVTRHYTDERMKYLIKLIDKHMERIEAGSSTGLWNTGIYVLAEDNDTVEIALNRLAGLYRGRDSYLDVIRTYSEGIKNGLICSYAKSMELIPMPAGQDSFLGPMYSYIATPLNTDELAIACNLPRNSYAGLRYNRDNVRYSYNPPVRSSRSIPLGTVYNEGDPIHKTFYLDADALVQHALLVGESGTGKTNTTRVLLQGLHKLGIPFLVIDPAKTGYLDMAIAYNRQHEADEDYEQKRIRIYMPGEDFYHYFDKRARIFEDVELDQFCINAYQPAVWEHSAVNLDAHISKLVDVITASMGLDYALPNLLKDIIRADLRDYYGKVSDCNNVSAETFFSQNPTIERLSYVLQREMDKKTYSHEVKGNLSQCINGMLSEVDKGWKCTLLAANRTAYLEKVFDYPAVISFARLGSDKDRMFAMSLIMMWLRDYRESRFNNDVAYRADVDGRNRLKHLVIVEEAHVVLSSPVTSVAGIANPGQKTAELMRNIFSEVREYGQGILAVDQYPSRLIEDVLNNTNSTMIHRIKNAKESEIMANRISLTAEQMQYLHSLKEGHIVIGYGSNEPCWVKVKPYVLE